MAAVSSTVIIHTCHILYHLHKHTIYMYGLSLKYTGTFNINMKKFKANKRYSVFGNMAIYTVVYVHRGLACVRQLSLSRVHLLTSLLMLHI